MIAFDTRQVGERNGEILREVRADRLEARLRRHEAVRLASHPAARRKRDAWLRARMPRREGGAQR